MTSMNRISAYHRYARDQSLIERHVLRREELTDERARQHLVAGFNRRLLMLQMSRSTIEDITHSPTNRPIGSYKATELATHFEFLPSESLRRAGQSYVGDAIRMAVAAGGRRGFGKAPKGRAVR